MIDEGIAAGRFREVDPFLVYISVLGPIMFYLMSEPVRTAIGRLNLVDADRLRTEAFVAHMQGAARRTLRRDEAHDARPLPIPPPRAPRRGRGRRPGEHA